MGAVKPGFGPREPREFGRGHGFNDDLTMTLQEKRETCKECPKTSPCCGGKDESLQCELFSKLLICRAAGLSNDRFVRPPKERMMYQDLLIDPCERCYRLGVSCIGKRLTKEEVEAFEGIVLPD